MLHYDKLGLKAVDWIPKIAEKYDCSIDAVKKDWSQRKTWMQTYLRIDDVENMALDILLDFEIALRDACKLYEEAEDVKIKIQTFWLRFKAMEMKMNFVEELGALGKIKSEFTLKNDLYRRKRKDEIDPMDEETKKLWSDLFDDLRG